jgi:arsenite-transporting ATPase
MRIILYTGKGGVGKTSVAASTALRCAELGYKTIVLSTDSAHSLSDSFDIALGDEPKLVVPNLWARETEMAQTVEKHWGRIKEWLAALMVWRGMDQIVADEMAVVPGMEELANLLYIISYYDSEQYDVIIVDCAPTGDTLRLLSFPEVLRWWMEKLFPLERKFVTVTRPLVKRVLKVPVPGDEVLDSAEDMFTELIRIRDILGDWEKSSIRLVLNPEKMVIKEAQRIFTYLNLYGYLTDLIVCNRLLPDRVDDRYFDSWKEAQGKYYQMIEECFAPLPILSAPLFEREVVGIPMLKVMGEALFADQDPSKLFFRGQAQEIEREDGCYVLTLPLPFLTKGDISLRRNGDELIVRAGRYKRNIILPQTLVGLSIKGAKFEDDKLRIRFEEKGKK